MRLLDVVTYALISTVCLLPSAHAQCSFRSLHPRRYNAYVVPDATPIVVDGKLDDAAWADAPFSEPFVDIMGPLHWSQPWFTTRVKMRYNASYLFVGAYLEDTSVWAHETQRNAVVFHDNDFEVFVDAAGHTHDYVEVEVNALNTTWNLKLNRPYRDGGHENSTRVDPDHGFDLVGQGFQSAVFTEGPPNDASQSLRYWTVEMALPMYALAGGGTAVPPHVGSFWRINFSRVQWATRVRADGTYEKIPGRREDNWVWSPQYAVNMHMPEQWGYVFFAGVLPPPGDRPLPPPPEDPFWSLRFFAFQLYYAQHAYRERVGRFATRLDAWFKPFVPVQAAVACMHVRRWSVPASGDTFEIEVDDGGGAYWFALIRSDGWIDVRHGRQNVDSAVVALE
ncbi:hypothetical protein PINS_up022530 [Pythium insidiosum]|nr:hypothetical protein PINS_up022530 [Pythium insidiosum]